MAKRGIKYTLLVLVGAVLVYNSVYIKSLQAVKAANKGFDVDGYASNYLFKTIPKSTAAFTDFALLRNTLQANPSEAFDAYSHAPSDGDIRYFMVNGSGVVVSKDSGYVWLEDSAKQSFKLASQYIYGTAARDAAGLVSVDSFDNTMVFNEVSEKINFLIKKQLTPTLQQLAVGDSLRFIGAIELNRKDPVLAETTIIPLHVEKSQKERR
ncbi:DUF2291 family protein [Olivibacter domesticus]|uniref:Predicted lipoprotein n=1 Tax=Olivibacter domesticus TaxID=407022 RepID=A0A1H7R2Q7_OLID1|nr:DUF2291 family protein [Olivibacter domesticus]SEL54452.1 Predicted lipoprotein [Olivibacter domesticus]